MTKTEMINKFKQLEGKVIQVETSDNFAVGIFTPTASVSTYMLKAKCKQRRLVVKVTDNYMETQVIDEEVVGYDSKREFAVQWIDNFLQGIKFLPHVSEEEQQKTLTSIKEDFYKELEEDELFCKREDRKVRCDFPKARDIINKGDYVVIYKNKFYLKEDIQND